MSEQQKKDTGYDKDRKVISLIVLEVKVGIRHTIVIVLSIFVIRIITRLVSILIRIPVI